MALEITLRPRPAMDDLTLTIAAAAISGWTSVRVTRGIERMPNSFEIALTSREASGLEVVAKDGDPCTVSLGGDLVITGHIDTVTRTIEPRNQTITIVGRSKSADVVDCAAELDSNFLDGATLPKLARDISEVYDIEVKADGAEGPKLPPVAYASGTTGASLIERAARYAGKLVYDNPDGSIRIGDIGTKRAASGFVEGKNILRAQAVFSQMQRFSEVRAYLVPMDMLKNLKGQPVDTSKGDVDNILASESDPNVKRRRMMAIISESGYGGVDICKRRARWEVARRKGRGTVVRLTADNWRDAADKLWEPNTLAVVDAPSLKLDAVELCIGEVVYRRDDEGTRAELVLMPPDAFKPEPILIAPNYQHFKGA